MDRILRTIQYLKYRIIIVILPQHYLNQILCKRLLLELEWPAYAWLVIDLNEGTPVQQACMKMAIVFSHIETNAIASNIECSKLETFSKNSSASPQSCRLYFIEYDTIVIHLWMSNPVCISNYSASLGFSYFFLDKIPDDSVPVESSLAWFVTFSLLHCLIFITLSVTLVAYLFYRKKPSIKATSVTLNIMTFISCYLLLVYLVAHNVDTYPGYARVSLPVRNFVCQIRLYFYGMSIPSVVIMSVILVRLIRVHRRFHSHKVLKKKWECHNLTLAAYVALLTLPMVLLRVLQTFLNDFERFEVITPLHKYFIVCRGTMDFEWGIGHFTYIGVLSSLLVVISIKTRTIRLKNFKETKQYRHHTRLMIISNIVYLFSETLSLSI